MDILLKCSKEEATQVAIKILNPSSPLYPIFYRWFLTFKSAHPQVMILHNGWPLFHEIPHAYYWYNSVYVPLNSEYGKGNTKTLLNL